IHLKILKKEFIFYFFIILIASLMGIVSFCLLEALHFVSNIRVTHNYLLYFLPIIGMLTAFIYQKYGRGAEKGNNLIIESTYSETQVPFRMSIFTFIFTILTHLFGGSAGREGSAVQIGGVLSNKVATHFHLEGERKQQMIYGGISAGFSSIFGTPLAGAFFGMEMVYLGKFERMALFPCLLASYVANFISTSLGVKHEIHRIQNIPAV
ncbi:chloride channel protein, partial [Listeria monocytogenes]|nr:chloride channel protein [Listeria monocytogenes]